MNHVAKRLWLLKEVNGIKVAILAYSYPVLMEWKEISVKMNMTNLSNLDERKWNQKSGVLRKADITVVMPQMGVGIMQQSR